VRSNLPAERDAVAGLHRRKPMTRTAVQQRLQLHAQTAQANCPSLRRRRISPHTIRHATAMILLQSGIAPPVIALWLGHEDPATTHQYIEADLLMKEKACGWHSRFTFLTSGLRNSG
jgi:integrase/recombinase XerD